MVTHLVLLNLVHLLVLTLTLSAQSFRRVAWFVVGWLNEHLRINSGKTIIFSLLAPMMHHNDYELGADGELTRLKQTVQSSQPGERASAARDLRNVARIVDNFGDEAHWEHFFQIVYDLGQDETANVRLCVLEQMPNLFQECRVSANLNPYVDRFLTVFVSSQLSATQQVRKAALHVISELLDHRLFSQDSLKNLLVPTLFLLVETLNQDYQHDTEGDPRVEVVRTLCQVVVRSALEDCEWIYHNFVPKYSYFLADHDFSIRKHAVSIIGQLSTLFGEKFTEQFVIPHVVSLTEDAMWGVRKAVCESFVTISHNCSPRVRKQVLVPRYLKLLTDSSRWVAYLASQDLGKFISTFADKNLTGLNICDGKVCFEESAPKEDLTIADNDDKDANVTRDENPFAILPEGCYIPEENNDTEMDDNGSDNSGDNTKRLFMMYERFNKSAASGGFVVDNCISAAASNKCASTDDLSKLGLDFNDEEMTGADDALDDDLDYSSGSDGFLNCSVLEMSGESSDDSSHNDSGSSDGQHSKSSGDLNENDTQSTESPTSSSPSSPNAVTYWSTGRLSISDDLEYWGASTSSASNSAESSTSTPTSDDLLTRRLDVLHKQSGRVPRLNFEDTEAVDSVKNEPSFDVHVKEEELDQNVTQDDSMDMDISLEEERGTTGKPEEGHQVLGTENDHQPIVKQETYADEPKQEPEPEPHQEALKDDYADVDMDTNVTVDTNATANLFSNNFITTNAHDDTRLLFPSQSGSDSDEKWSNDVSQEIVPQELVDWFVSLDVASDTDVFQHRARHFPAVAFTLGRLNWNQLRETYHVLSQDTQWKVRASLAASMHQMAAIVGPHHTVADLVPVFEKFREDCEEVRSGLLDHLYEFCEKLDDESRLEMLNKLPHMLRIDNEANWRFRKQFASQCGRLCSLYSVDAVNRGLAGIALTLCIDKCAEVRSEASLLTARIIGLMLDEEWPRDGEKVDLSELPLTNGFVQDIVKGFARSRTARRRQTFAQICQFALEGNFVTQAQFAAYFLDNLITMAKDRVSSVRLWVGKVLKLTGCPSNEQSAEKIQETLIGLRDDTNFDVRYLARLSKEGMEEDGSEVVDVTGRALIIREKEEQFFCALEMRQKEAEGESRNLSDLTDMSVCSDA